MMECFRPLSGSYISQLFFLLIKVNILCFRPLSGSYISQSEYDQHYRETDERFPSPIGELHFSISDTRRTVQRTRVSVPYRGATFLNGKKDYRRSSSTEVSVPYRGATFLNVVLPTITCLTEFPSPIGELHFSIPSPQPHVLSGTNRGIAGEK